MYTQQENELPGDKEVNLVRLKRELRQKTDELTNVEAKVEKSKQSLAYFKEAASVAENNLKKVGLPLFVCFLCNFTALVWSFGLIVLL